MKISLNKKYILSLLVVFLLLPVLVVAQTSGLYQDGSGDWGSVRQQRIHGYRQQSSELQQKITTLGSTPVVSVFMPVLFGVSVKDISPNFGDPRAGGRTHEGEDIMAVKGTPIISPTAAVVLRTGTGDTEGNYVYTANPGGETFIYMHLDRVGEGVVSGLVLEQGSLIGYVGNTGNASGGPAHLHFEIHTSGTIVDPFPRLTGEFSLQQKILYLSTILTQTIDAVALSQLLVTNFQSTFKSALTANIILPLPIMNVLALMPVISVQTNTMHILPLGDLDVGSSGSFVVALQKYLIQAASGPAASRLALVGATGNFGTLTKTALIEFQVAVGISPASGYYGPVTRAFVSAHPLVVSLTPVSNTPSIGGTAGIISRDLYRNLVGEDVRMLQKLLNTNGYIVAVTGAGSLGNETTYFGAATQAAVVRFQIARGISPAAGYVGPLTRAALASL